MRREDLTTLGEVLDEGDAGLVVVYSADMADRVNASITRARRTRTREPRPSRRISGRRLELR